MIGCDKMKLRKERAFEKKPFSVKKTYGGQSHENDLQCQ